MKQIGKQATGIAVQLSQLRLDLVEIHLVLSG
jgi:hypothetical protein